MVPALDSLYYIAHVYVLDGIVAGNRLTAIAPRIAELKHLRTLDLADNQLDDLPIEAISSLAHLDRVDLSRNPITPEFIDALRSKLASQDTEVVFDMDERT